MFILILVPPNTRPTTFLGGHLTTQANWGTSRLQRKAECINDLKHEDIKYVLLNIQCPCSVAQSTAVVARKRKKDVCWNHIHVWDLCACGDLSSSRPDAKCALVNSHSWSHYIYIYICCQPACLRKNLWQLTVLIVALNIQWHHIS